MNMPKRHHFVPELHLKHFVGPDPAGHVHTYDAQSGEVRSSLPENTGLQGHYYSAVNSDGTTNVEIEAMLGDFENKAAPVYQQLLADEVPPIGDQRRADFAGFLAISYMRTPSMRRMTAEMMGRELQIRSYMYGSHPGAFESLMSDMEKDLGRKFSAEERERRRQELLDMSNLVIEIPQQNTFQMLGAADNLTPLFYKMKWCVIEAKHGFFVTSDTPLVRNVAPGSHHPLYGDHGFMNKTAEVTFPLSPSKMLALTWHDSGTKQRLGRDFVDMMNETRAVHAERYLFAHIRHKRISQLAKQFKDVKSGMTTRGFGPKKFADVEVGRFRKPKQD